MRALAEVISASSCSIGMCFSEHERCFSNISPRFVPLSGMMTTGTETWLQSITVSGDITIPAGELVISDGMGYSVVRLTYCSLKPSISDIVSHHYSMRNSTWGQSRSGTGLDGSASSNRNSPTSKKVGHRCLAQCQIR